MLVKSEGASPFIDPTAQVSPHAVLSGDVHVGPRCRIGHGAVLIAEGGPVRLGADCVVMETAVIRGVPGQATRRKYCPPASDAIWASQKALDFPRVVFNQARPGPGESMMTKLMPKYAAALRRRHAADEAIG